MRLPFKKLFSPLVIVLILSNISLPTGSRAQTYPIDCAILLCLSGGWPASVPCSRARAEFIRRITPWPVEPPLQIWRCPMGASYEMERQSSGTVRIFEALFNSDFNADDYRPGQSIPVNHRASDATSEAAAWRFDATLDVLVPAEFALRLVQDRADIDISGPEFNFVRSIRVFDVRSAWQRESPRDGDCYRNAAIFLGTYGTQGGFSWQRTSTSALPSVHEGLERWGDSCPSIYHRSVFVDWRDYQGNYGFEQVNY
ncbi:hypothetical protein [Sulfitobacter mediterraneus]|uniref:hypothetical protein n=1 Tax=Sulfitobacter mediterraneus TaxID=83219 RepID=UPI001EEE3D87|nr:hypothetical protein [Sulfitobacter mediterraneus]